MKKKVIISVVVAAVALAMILVICLLILGACSLTPRGVEDDPHSALSGAVLLSLAEFMSFDGDLQATMTDALTSGSVEFQLGGNYAWGKLLGSEYSDMEISASLYNNVMGGESALFFDANVPDGRFAGQLFASDEVMIVESKSLLGDDVAYSITPSVVREKFAGSAFEEMLRIPEEDKEAVREAVRKFFDGDDVDISERAKKFYEALCYEVTTVSDDGKSLIVVTLYLNNETLEDALLLAEEDVSLTEALGLRDFGYIDTIRSVLRDIEEIDAEVHISIDRYSRKLHGATAELEMVPDSGAYRGATITGEVELKATESDISFGAFFDIDLDEPLRLGWELALRREVEDDKTNYTFSYSKTTENDALLVKEKLLDIEFEYDKEGREIWLEVEDRSLGIDFFCNGEVVTEDGVLTVRIDKFGTGDVSINPNISITYNRNAAVPDPPEEAIEFIELDRRGIEEFMKKLRQNSVLYK